MKTVIRHKLSKGTPPQQTRVEEGENPIIRNSCGKHLQNKLCVTAPSVGRLFQCIIIAGWGKECKHTTLPYHSPFPPKKTEME